MALHGMSWEDKVNSTKTAGCLDQFSHELFLATMVLAAAVVRKPKHVNRCAKTGKHALQPCRQWEPCDETGASRKERSSLNRHRSNTAFAAS